MAENSVPDILSMVKKGKRLTERHEWEELAEESRGILAALRGREAEFHREHIALVLDAAEQSVLGHPEIAPLAEQLGGAALARLRFREAHEAELSRGTYVSLGCECHAWNLLNRWGFRDSLRDLNPLCLGIHRMPKLLEILESRFAAYARPENLSMRIHPASQLGMVVDDEMGVTWNHHRGEIWTGDGFGRFRADMERLTGNFYASSRRPGAIHVISGWRGFCPETHASEISRLLELIAGAGASAPHLVILDFERGKAAAGPQKLPDCVDLVTRPYPEAYGWANPRSYNSDAGAAWERAVAEDFAAIVRRRGPEA